MNLYCKTHTDGHRDDLAKNVQRVRRQPIKHKNNPFLYQLYQLKDTFSKLVGLSKHTVGFFLSREKGSLY